MKFATPVLCSLSLLTQLFITVLSCCCPDKLATGISHFSD